MQKTCSACGFVGSTGEFHKDAHSGDGYSSCCKPCNKDRARAWYHANKERGKERRRLYNIEKRVQIRNANLVYKFGITLDEYGALLDSQGGGCAICGATEEKIDGRCMPVDHDHSTNSVRGVLCSSCNRGIGLLGDDPERLMNAAFYLAKFANALGEVTV